MSNAIVGSNSTSVAITGGVFNIHAESRVPVGTSVGSNNIIAAMTGGVLSLKSLAITATGTDILQMSPASIIANYIISSLSLMSDPSDGDDWPLYIASLPDGPQIETDCGAVYDSGGVTDGKYMSGGIMQHQGVQVRIRSQSQETAYEKIEEIAIALDESKFASIEIGDLEFLIQNISRTTSIAFMGVDQGTKRRSNFSVNFLVTIKELTG